MLTAPPSVSTAATAENALTVIDAYVYCLGVCYTAPLVGGRIADMIAGRFNTIYASFLILFVGTLSAILIRHG